MLAAIQDYEILIYGGMGRGAHNSISASGIKVIMVDNLEINSVLESNLSGTLASKKHLIH